MMDGFLNINKSPGMTSYDVIRQLKKILPPSTKIGHLGTLDPMASGVLPIAVGQATKIISYIDNESKAYIAEMVIGGISDTQDAWGNINCTGNVTFEDSRLEVVLDKYRGIIKQIPPMYSAVHYQGQRLYELARKGIIVEREPRTVEIKKLEVLQIDKDNDLPRIKLYVQCSRGTYIRTLCHDLGMELETGAYMSELVRVKSGVFTLEDSYKIEDIKSREELQKILLPLDYPLAHLDSYYLRYEKELKAVKNGNIIKYRGNLPSTDKVKIYWENSLLAIGVLLQKDDGKFLKPEKVIRV
ncbi:tRNA pseudouridine(55) synthase TruB [Thermosyntropha sp.]|uniref:tRNA pseudouridine(55) synthase TruB n=1 Tax=Thermosyntropha sp. TaxID=2740820 RepID=UPI0025D251F6|nr:tRNA pseudouridine(55) synthase TruB [Thermosyntropha sp.]MBO8158309.1 tRNA pseudouridine(55) synthase TruB [Thermosyntropha sp.]